MRNWVQGCDKGDMGTWGHGTYCLKQHVLLLPPTVGVDERQHHLIDPAVLAGGFVRAGEMDLDAESCRADALPLAGRQQTGTFVDVGSPSIHCSVAVDTLTNPSSEHIVLIRNRLCHDLIVDRDCF